MLRFFRRFFQADPSHAVARNLYEQAVHRARRPEFYRDAGVPDTVDGRFDMITLHVFLLLNRLKNLDEAGRDVAQQLFDVMFADMDESLREMGVGDVSVGKKVKKMASAFYGRIEAYDRALDEKDPDALTAALRRNIYREKASTESGPKRLAVYARAESAALAGKTLADLAEGDIWSGDSIRLQPA